MTRVKGLLYLLILISLVAGVPAVLYLFAGNPIPTSLPNGDDTINALSTPDDGSLFLAALVWIGWIAWAVFTLSVVLELAALARDGGAHPRRTGTPAASKVRVLAPTQRLAATLIGGAFLVFTAGTAGASPLLGDTAHQTPYTQDLHQAPETSYAQAPAWATTPATPAPGPTITTNAHDTLWSLAEQYLGEGSRYPEIVALNTELLAGSENWIQPGWTLTLPAATIETIDGAYTVTAGDTLWSLAENHLGDGSRWTEITGPNVVPPKSWRVPYAASGVVSASLIS